MPERIILDPSEVSTGRTELEITPWVAAAGISYGDAAMESYMAEQAVGSSPVDYRIPNRGVEIPLVLKESGGTTFATIRSAIQSKVGLWQQQGGAIKRITASGGTVYLDVLSAQLRFSGDWLQAHRDVDVNAAITLEAKPDFYEDEVTLTDHTETTATELIFTEDASTGGDFPLGDRVRLVVDDDQGQDQRGLIWHFRARHYYGTAESASAYEAEALDPLDTAAGTALTGASGGTAVAHTGLLNAWTPVLGTNIGGTTYMTHTGTNRVYARCYSTDGTAVSARFVWNVGDLVNPVENEPVTMIGGSAFYVLDLGEVRLDPAPVGAHRWQGQIQAQGTDGGEDLYIDRVWIVNGDESSGILRALPVTSTTAETVTAWDAFGTHAAGTLIGKTAPLGGTWGEAGDTTDFLTDGSGLAYRTATSDADLNTGQYARLGTGTLAYTDVQADIYVPTGGASRRQGVFARYTDANNWLMAVWDSGTSVKLLKRVTGTVTTLGSWSDLVAAGVWRTIRLIVGSNGIVAVTEGPQGGAPTWIIGTSADANLATGGALDEGGYGLYDAYTSASALTRYYDNFYVRTISASQSATDAVIFASQSADLSTQGIYREDSDGAAYGPVSTVTGDLPRFPNQSSGGTAEVFVKASRGDFTTSADSGIDDISGRVYRRKSWLYVPE